MSERGQEAYKVDSITTGTFARVCLVRLASPTNETERNKVFALKILRKTEGQG